MSTFAKYPVVLGSGGGGGGDAFTIIQTDTGTSPTATGPNDTLTLTSSDLSVSIAGNSATDTVDFKVTIPVQSVSNVGSGAGHVYKTLTAGDVKLKTIKAGTSITVTDNTDDITLDASVPIQSVTNIGTGTGTIFTSLSGTAAQLKTIKAGTNITLTNNASDITLDATGLSISSVDNSVVRVDGTVAVQGSGIFVDDVASQLVNVHAADNAVNNATDADSVQIMGGNKTAGASANGGSVELAAGRNTTQSSSANWYGSVVISADGAKTIASANGGRVLTYAFDQFSWFIRSFSTSVDILRVGTTRFLFRNHITMLDASGTENTLDIGKSSGGTLERPRNVFIANWLGIGTGATPTTSTIAEFTSTTGAVLFPRMTSTQRDALTATNGMVLYNSTTDKLQVRAAGAWVDLH